MALGQSPKYRKKNICFLSSGLFETALTTSFSPPPYYNCFTFIFTATDTFLASVSLSNKRGQPISNQRPSPDLYRSAVYITKTTTSYQSVISLNFSSTQHIKHIDCRSALNRPNLDTTILFAQFPKKKEITGILEFLLSEKWRSKM